jgi:hypothetical protein
LARRRGSRGLRAIPPVFSRPRQSGGRSCRPPVLSAGSQGAAGAAHSLSGLQKERECKISPKDSLDKYQYRKSPHNIGWDNHTNLTSL